MAVPPFPLPYPSLLWCTRSDSVYVYTKIHNLHIVFWVVSLLCLSDDFLHLSELLLSHCRGTAGRFLLLSRPQRHIDYFILFRWNTVKVVCTMCVCLCMYACTIRKATVPQIQHYLMPVLMLNTGRTGRGGFLHCFPINVLIPSMLASNVARQSDSWNSWVLNSAQKSRVVSAVDIARAQESVQSEREWEGIPTVRVKCDKYLNATLCRAFMFIQQLALLFVSMPLCLCVCVC